MNRSMQRHIAGFAAVLSMLIFAAPNSYGYPYQRYVEDASERHGVETALIRAVMRAESNYDPYALSHKGAIGLMQLLITTAREHEPWVSRFQLQEEPDVNIDIGARHLKDLERQVRQRYPGVHGLDRIRLIAAAYNAGWGRVVRARGRIPSILETRIYTRRVARYYRAFGGKQKPVAKPVRQAKPARVIAPQTSPINVSNTSSVIPSPEITDSPPAFRLGHETIHVIFMMSILFMAYVMMGWSHLSWMMNRTEDT